MDFLIDIAKDAFLDTARLLPFLFLCYLAMEAIEHRAGERTEDMVRKAGKAGPLVGSLLGVFPQCGFSAAAATLYAGRVITFGTLVAVFLATSDEMLPIFIAEQVDPVFIAKILGVKVVIGMIMGFVIDAAIRALTHGSELHMHIHEMCEQEHCDCEDGVLKSAVRHTLQVALFILIISLVLNGAIEALGEETIAGFLSANPILSVCASSLVGLIPNCAASVIITELFLEGAISTGAMLGGLLTSAGVGLLVLFRVNRPLKQNFLVMGLIWVIGVAWGVLFDLAGIVF